MVLEEIEGTAAERQLHALIQEWDERTEEMHSAASRAQAEWNSVHTEEVRCRIIRDSLREAQKRLNSPREVEAMVESVA